MRALIAVLLLTAAVFAGIVHNPPVYEEHGYPYHPEGLYAYQTSGGRLAALRNVGRSWSNLAVMIWPADAVLVRVENVGLHLSVVLLVSLLASRLGAGAWGWVAGGVMGLHPLNLEAVAYGVETAEILIALGCLLAVIGVLRGGAVGGAVVLFLGLVTMAIKASGAAVVPIVFLMGLYLLDTSDRWTGSAIGVLVALCLGKLPAVAALNDAATSLGPVMWARVLSGQVWRHLFQFVTLRGFAIDEPIARGPETWVALGGVLVLGGLSLYLIERRHVLAACGVGWIVAALSLRFVVRVPLEVLPDHQFYTASIGLALLSADVARRAGGHATVG